MCHIENLAARRRDVQTLTIAHSDVRHGPPYQGIGNSKRKNVFQRRLERQRCYDREFKLALIKMSYNILGFIRLTLSTNLRTEFQRRRQLQPYNAT